MMLATQLHVEIGRQAYSVSLSETPLVIGLVLLAPTWLLIASPLGAAIAMLIQRNAPRKTWFNVALSALEPMVAATVFGGMLTASESGPWMWLAAFVAILVVGTVDGVAVTAVISLQNGRPTPTEVRTAVATFVASATLNTTIALLIVIVLQAEPGGLILVAALGAVLVAAYRAYAKLLRRHESLGLLYEFQEAIDWTAASDELVQALLREARRLLRAESAAVRLVPVDSSGETSVTVMLDEYNRTETVLTRPEMRGALRTRVLAGAAVLAPQGTKDAEVRQWLEEQHFCDAMIVPLRAESGVVGTLEVANRLGATGTFTADDLQLLETFGAQAGLALQAGRLLDQLRYDAEYDALTGLANRSRFLHRLELALEEAAGQPGSGPAVLLLDLNRFKEVNDTLGHDVGDRLLHAVGARIAAVVPAQATVARLGGDEYAVLLPRCAAGEADALSVAGAVHQALDQPFPLDGFNLDASAAIGAAYSTEGGLDATTMLARADIAMYAAKKALLPVQTYSAELDQTTPRRLALVGELRHAIDHGGLVLHYQPQVALSTHTLAGVEALVRWQHPLHGLIYPDEFIPAGGAHRADHCADHCRAAHGTRAVPRLVGPGSPDRGGGQHLRPRADRLCLPRQGRRGIGGNQRAGEPAHLGIDRRQRHDRPVPYAARPTGAARAGGGAVHRRLRHRLLLTGLPLPAPGRRGEDRQVVCHADGQRRQLLHDRARRCRPRSQPRSAGGGRGGRGRSQPGGPDADGLRSGQGLPIQPPGIGGGVAGVAFCRGRVHPGPTIDVDPGAVDPGAGGQRLALARRPQSGLGPQCTGSRLHVIGTGLLRPLQRRPSPTGVDVRGQLGHLREDGYAGVGDRQEPTVNSGHNLAAGLLDPHHAALGELAEQRRVPRQHAELPLGGPGDDHVRLAGPNLSVDRNDLHVQLRHRFSSYPSGRVVDQCWDQ